MDSGEFGVGEGDVGDGASVAGDEVDDAGREAGGFEEPHEQDGGVVCVGDGFHTTTLPMRAGAVGRLPAMAVKLNGVTA